MSDNRIVRLCASWHNYLWSYRSRKDPYVWVFGEWFGQRCGDNCTYFANYVVSVTDNIQIYWVCNKDADTSILDKRIVVLDKGSKEADEILKKAGAIFLNQNFLDVGTTPFNHYGKALSINFWHGFPWKKIGHDGYKNDGLIFRLYCKLIDPVEKTKKYITISDIYSEKIKSAFGVKSRQFIKSGYPRNSILHDDNKRIESRERLIRIIKESHPKLNTEGLRIISYMPTFRDKGDSSNDLKFLLDDDFVQKLRDDNVVIIQKAHFVDIERDKNNQNDVAISNILSINNINAAVLLAGSDVLISDYSSCIFDFLITDRPIIHYIYDYENYRDKDRGVYFSIDEISCGIVAYTKKELQRAIIHSLEKPDEMRELRERRRKLLMQYENSTSCEELYKYVHDYLGIQ